MVPTVGNRSARRLGSLVVAALVVSVVVTAPALAERIAELARAAAPAMIELRHDLHQFPELSNREERTAAKLASRLEALGLEVRTGIAHTGVLAVLQGGRPGPTVAVRADIDALPVTEQTELPFRSSVRTTFLGQEVGVAHACGHDVHTAVGMGVAVALAQIRDELPGTVLFVFQPAEEGAPPGERGGADLMIEEGVFDPLRPAAIFALHSWPELEVGEVGVAAGPTFAAVDRFTARVIGRQSHGAMPHQGIDPVVAASQAVTAFQTIPSRTLDPRAAAVVTVGIFRAGERFNIIPGEALLQGTVRTYSLEVQDTIERRMGEILGGITAAAGGSYELQYDRITPATHNDEVMHQRALGVLSKALGEANVHVAEPSMAGEDFAYFTELAPGYYFRLGTRSPGGYSGALHTPDFTADDGAVEVGIRAMASLVLDALEGDLPQR